MKIIPFIFWMLLCSSLQAQERFEQRFSALPQLTVDSGVTITFDEPQAINIDKPTKLIIYALPNGNTTAQTFGKKLAKDDDWHFDIQHIGAQTAFIRSLDPNSNYIVAYVENTLKSWPAWRRKYSNSDLVISKLVDTIATRYKAYHPKITLSGHSGGGSFIFGFINSKTNIPLQVERIGFLDATYGYETNLYVKKLENWLKTPKHYLQIFAYNDSVVVNNGKPLVSPTGGTWYRSKLMANDLGQIFQLKMNESKDQLYFYNKRHTIEIKLIKNPDAKIFHTVLVEKNGFIDLIFSGTKFANKQYVFWSDRAYSQFIFN